MLPCVTHLRKTPTAHRTLERFLSTVDAHVRSEVSSLREVLPAQLTEVRLVSVVAPYVSTQTTRAGARLAADATLVVLVGGRLGLLFL